MKFTRNLAVITLLSLAPVFAAAADTTDDPIAKLAPTPPMGWNSWNKFRCTVDEKLIRKVADAMVSSGMKDAGYQYVNIDDCWQSTRDAKGEIVADPQRFPSGIKALADYVHSKGLKLGVYTDVGPLTCQKRPGSLGHEEQDAKTYAAWGIDYVKADWCYTEGLDPEVQYAKFHAALMKAGRPIVLSLCEWGVKTPWKWAAADGNLWRTTRDIRDNYDSMTSIGFGQSGLEQYARPGHWNDPDMLEVGNGGMNSDEYRTHMTLWSLLAAPLLAGNDIRDMTQDTKDLLMNKEVIAVDQDAKGEQAHHVWEEGPVVILARRLADGSQAVGLFNQGEAPTGVTLDLGKIGVSGKAKLRNLWAHKDLGDAQGSYTSQVPRHGAVLIKVSE